jgi:hypothetical protein
MAELERELARLRAATPAPERARVKRDGKRRRRKVRGEDG